MLIFDRREIGNRLLFERKRLGLTQSEVAERAGLSDRTYADIERGSVNMRVETALRICKALGVMPNDVFTKEGTDTVARAETLMQQLTLCSSKEQTTGLQLLQVYLQSLHRDMP